VSALSWKDYLQAGAAKMLDGLASFFGKPLLRDFGGFLRIRKKWTEQVVENFFERDLGTRLLRLGLLLGCGAASTYLVVKMRAELAGVVPAFTFGSIFGGDLMHFIGRAILIQKSSEFVFHLMPLSVQRLSSRISFWPIHIAFGLLLPFDRVNNIQKIRAMDERRTPGFWETVTLLGVAGLYNGWSTRLMYDTTVLASNSVIDLIV
jgi:hypothetical protein